MGDSPEAIPTRLAQGEIADVVILDGVAADELARREWGTFRHQGRLAGSLIGMVVRAGAAKPDIGSVETFKRTLLAATSIAYSDSSSGTYLSTVLFAKLGIADQIARKSRKVRGPPSGEPVAAVVARGEVEIGFQQVSDLIHVPGISFVGTIPSRPPEDGRLRRGADPDSQGAGGRERPNLLPRVPRRGAGDPKGRTGRPPRQVVVGFPHDDTARRGSAAAVSFARSSSLTLLAAALLAATTGLSGVASPQPAVPPTRPHHPDIAYQSPIALGVAGYAKVLCSAVFVSGAMRTRPKNSGFFLMPDPIARGRHVRRGPPGARAR